MAHIMRVYRDSGLNCHDERALAKRIVGADRTYPIGRVVASQSRPLPGGGIWERACGHLHQCIMNTGTLACSRSDRVTPPKARSLSRLWPNPPTTSKSARRSAAARAR